MAKKMNTMKKQTSITRGVSEKRFPVSMKRTVLYIAVALFATNPLLAGPKEDVQDAIKKLADAANYSWSTSTTNAAGSGGRAGGGGRGGRGGFGGPSQGKLSKDGFAIVTRTFNENTIETVIKGDKSVTRNQDGAWQTPEERAAARGNGNGGGRGRGGMGANSLPHVQAAELLAGVKELKAAEAAGGIYIGNGFSGDLTKEAAARRLAFGGGRRGGAGGEAPAPPADAKGSAKFWVKEGVLSKLEFNVQGTMSFNGNDFLINRTTTIEIKDVGTTKAEVPEDAKKKLQ